MRISVTRVARSVIRPSKDVNRACVLWFELVYSPTFSSLPLLFRSLRHAVIRKHRVVFQIPVEKENTLPRIKLVASRDENSENESSNRLLVKLRGHACRDFMIIAMYHRRPRCIMNESCDSLQDAYLFFASLNKFLTDTQFVSRNLMISLLVWILLLKIENSLVELYLYNYFTY